MHEKASHRIWRRPLQIFHAKQHQTLPPSHKCSAAPTCDIMPNNVLRNHAGAQRWAPGQLEEHTM